MTKPSDFANANIPEIVEKLTLEEVIALTAGKDHAGTFPIPRFGVPSIKGSDGPNGVRGGRTFMGTPAKCIPSATALAATFDVDLVGEAAEKLLAAEAKLRAASFLLAPTVNIQRSPLGGRSFESFSEDPHLSGHIAASYIKNVQKGGIGACIKHFCANDQEDDRFAVDSIVGPRALREIYLYPFMIATKYAQPWSYMTAYNKLNGTHCSENPFLLKEVLRGEWGYTGLVMSDWFGTYSVTESINASLDLEMPALDRWRTEDHVKRSIEARKITVRTVKERATKVLEFVQKAAKGAPDVLDGDHVERTLDTPADRELMRKVASNAIVLLKNEHGLLPLKVRENGIKKIAIIGPNAKAAIISGGGSAALKASYIVTPYDGIVSALPKDVEVSYIEGCQAFEVLPSLDREIRTADGKVGWIGTFHSTDGNGNALSEAVETDHLDETNLFVNDAYPAALTEKWRLHVKGYLPPRDHDVTFEFGLTVAGRAKLYLDGKLLIDNWTTVSKGHSFFGNGSLEEKATTVLKAGKTHEVFVEYANDRPDGTLVAGGTGSGVRLGGREVHNEDQAIQEAADLAAKADVAILVVGLNSDWEAEGHDRTTLALPRRTDELVEKVLKANPKTVVVTQSGSAIAMPWIDSAGTLVHAWYLGNETGNAIADVLFGKVNPSGKLSLTFPKKLEDVPSHLHFGSQNGKVRYAEDLFVGYRHYQNKSLAPLFPFGFGLSYTTFEFSNLAVSKPSTDDASFTATASVVITNTGPVSGSEAVQLYISPPVSAPTPSPRTGYLHPRLQLKGFAKVKDLQPGKSETVTIPLDKYAVSYWDDVIHKWVGEGGEYKVVVGASSEDARLSAGLKIPKTFEWKGL